MVGESRDYKDYLLAFSAKLQRWHTTNRWSEKRLIEYEKEVFICFFYIRKLIEAKRLTLETEKRRVSLAYYRPIRPVHRLKTLSIERIYDLDNHNHCDLPLSAFCNQIIHSYIFHIFYGHSESYIIVSSDYKKNEIAYRLDHDELIALLRLIAKDDANYCLKGRWSNEKWDYEFEFTNKLN